MSTIKHGVITNTFLHSPTTVYSLTSYNHCLMFISSYHSFILLNIYCQTPKCFDRFSFYVPASSKIFFSFFRHPYQLHSSSVTNHFKIKTQSKLWLSSNSFSSQIVTVSNQFTPKSISTSSHLLPIVTCQIVKFLLFQFQLKLPSSSSLHPGTIPIPSHIILRPLFEISSYLQITHIRAIKQFHLNSFKLHCFVNQHPCLGWSKKWEHCEANPFFKNKMSLIREHPDLGCGFVTFPPYSHYNIMNCRRFRSLASANRN